METGKCPVATGCVLSLSPAPVLRCCGEGAAEPVQAAGNGILCLSEVISRLCNIYSFIFSKSQFLCSSVSFALQAKLVFELMPSWNSDHSVPPARRAWGVYCACTGRHATGWNLTGHSCATSSKLSKQRPTYGNKNTACCFLLGATGRWEEIPYIVMGRYIKSTLKPDAIVSEP